MNILGLSPITLYLTGCVVIIVIVLVIAYFHDKGSSDG